MANERITLFVRGVTESDRQLIKSNATKREITMGEYISRTVRLHERMRRMADGGDIRIAGHLEDLGIGSINETLGHAKTS